jgi:DNA-binding response OmpR family regulator
MTAKPKQRMTPLVLIAEDDGDICDLVVMVLEDEEYEVVTAPNGAEALELATAEPPDLCILDVMMPKLDGVELTRKLRKLKKTSEVPIILLSARTQWEAVVRGREAGADEYLTKPFVADDLLRSVRGLLVDAAGSDGPVEPAEQEVLDLLADAEPEQVNGSHGLVLVAAPNENLVHLVSYRLGLGGYEVATAHDSEEAAQLASERKPDLCLFDASMTEIDGIPVKHIDASVSVQELYGEVEKLLGADAPSAG